MIQKFAIVLSTICFFLLSACNAHNYSHGVNNSDWEYVLPNDYVIWHVNSQSIVFGKKNSEYSISHVTDDYVKRFSYNDEYIFLQCVANKENNDNQIKHYIVEVQNDKVIGPLTESEYDEYIVEHNMISPYWIDTSPTPQGVSYN